MDSSLDTECRIRLENLYKNSHTWLSQVSYNITKSTVESEDLVSELYEYLHNKKNKKLFYLDSYNLMYCMAFLKHRWINKTKKLGRLKYFEEITTDAIDDEYDVEFDLSVMKAHEDVLNEIKKLKNTKSFAPAMIYEIYWTSDATLQEVADKLHLSKSTVFINIKKVRKYLKNTIKNPFE